MKKSFKIGVIIIVIGIVIIAGLFYYKSKQVKVDKASSISKEKLQNSQVGNEEEFTDITLYFGASDNSSGLVKEERLINNEELLGEIIMQELIKGPAVVSEGKALIPKDTKLLNFSISEGTAHINFSGEIKTSMSAEQEEALLKSIASSMIQLKTVGKILITVDSERVETLGGNYNVSEAFSKSDIPSLLVKK